MTYIVLMDQTFTSLREAQDWQRWLNKNANGQKFEVMEAEFTLTEKKKKGGAKKKK